jgi:hypothetical protein
MAEADPIALTGGGVVITLEGVGKYITKASEGQARSAQRVGRYGRVDPSRDSERAYDSGAHRGDSRCESTPESAILSRWTKTTLKS